MRLYSSVIKLLALHPASLEYSGGQHAHAAFLEIVRQVDPALSQALHENRGKGARQPFTISPLMGLPHPHRASQTSEVLKTSEVSAVHLREGWECWLRVTMLNETLFRYFIEYFLKAEGKTLPKIRLGDAHFAVSEILTTPGVHPWAGFTTLEDLQKRLDEPAPAQIAFEFVSPTSFKLQDERVELLPLPRRVFGNLATAWKALRPGSGQALTGEDMVRAVEEYAEQNLQLQWNRMEKRALIIKHHPQLGMVGPAVYHFRRPEDTPLARALNLLADLAFYTGIGRKTAQGMGMVRRIKDG
ncbi:MAG: hypothetical protein Kow0070_14690 [Anaerolineales bacterium]